MSLDTESLLTPRWGRGTRSVVHPLTAQEPHRAEPEAKAFLGRRRQGCRAHGATVVLEWGGSSCPSPAHLPPPWPLSLSPSSPQLS